MARLIVTDIAELDIRSAHAWWQEQRSREQADRWYRGIVHAIHELRHVADRCPVAPECDLLPTGVRQRSFGLGRRPTHRIVFTIVQSDVIVLRVRHSAQEALTENELG